MKLWNYIEPDFHNGDCDGDEGEQYWDSSVGYQFLHVGDFNGQNIRKTVVTLQPELKICLQRGLDDQGKTDCEKSFEQQNFSENNIQQI